MYPKPRIARGRLGQLWSSSLRCARAIQRHIVLGPSGPEKRGIELLREWLSPEQLEQYETYNYFEVTGCDTGRRYRIRHGNGSNILELDDKGRIKAGWCFVPTGSLVSGDVVLAQKIALETQETSALTIAKQFTATWH